MTFNIETLQFAAFLQFKKCNEIFLYKVFYCYSNILKDIIIFVKYRYNSSIVYILKESNGNCLFIYNEISLSVPPGYMIHDISYCNNRNNEIILFIKAFDDNEVGNDFASYILLYYDILNGGTCKTFHQFNNPDGFYSDVFFNSTGEEMFVVDENQLYIYVYKSKVRSLKRTCQIIVLEQYSTEQLNLMNLPKYLLCSDGL